MLVRCDKLLFTAVVFIGAVSVGAQNFEQQMEAEIEKLVAKNGNGTNTELKQRLFAMAKRDQAVRAPEYVSDAVPESLIKEQERVDMQLTAQLKER